VVGGSVYVRISGTANPPVYLTDPCIFSRRVPATVKTLTPQVSGTSATLKGTAKPYNTGIAIIPTCAGLDWDSILTTGFIYSTNNVALTIDEYSKEIKVNGVSCSPQCTFPTTVGGDGSFLLGGYTFYLVKTPNTPNVPLVNMSEVITIDPSKTYYVYSFMEYKFQTSNIFPALGEQVEIKPTGCTNAPEITLATSDTVHCGTGLFTIPGNSFSTGTVIDTVYTNDGKNEPTFILTGSNTFTINYTPHTNDMGNTITIVVTTTDPGAPCKPDTAYMNITFDNLTVGFNGPNEICEGANTQLTPATTGWESNNPTIATVDDNGKVTALTAGTTTFTFTNSNHCTALTPTLTVKPKVQVSATIRIKN
jgi:hypothetical protein